MRTSKFNERFAVAATQNKKAEAFWNTQLKDDPIDSHLPHDLTGDPGDVPRHQITFCFDSELFKRLSKMSKGSDKKLHIILTAAVLALDYAYSSTPVQSIGIPAYRQKTAGEYINTFLPIRSRCTSETTFRSFLQGVNEQVQVCIEHQNFPIGYLAEMLRDQRMEQTFSLFDTLVSLAQIHDEDVILSIACNILFAFEIRGDTLNLTIDYSVSLFSEASVHRTVKHLEILIDQVINFPDRPLKDLTLMRPSELLAVKDFGLGQVYEFVGESVHDQFIHQALLHPDGIALVEGSERLTYREVNHRSDCIADFLLKQGVHRGEIIGLLLKPGHSMWVFIAGILKSGCAYLPLDPDLPASRIEFIIKDSGLTRVLCSEDSIGVSLPNVFVYTAGMLEGLYSSTPSYLRQPSSPEDLCYVIYTSGSTGTPKGVMITHGNILNYSFWFIKRFGIGFSDSSVLTSSYSFDLGYSSVYPVLLGGGTLHFLRRDEYLDSTVLVDYVSSQGITYLKMTPTLFSTWVNSGSHGDSDLPSLRLLLLGGEPIRLQEVRTLQERHGHIQVMNHYGPTETTVGVIVDEVVSRPKEFSVRTVIGRAIYNTEVLILDSHLRRQPVGIPGEICIGGQSVGRGYMNSPEQTARQFVVLGDSGIIYRTGDMGRMLEDGRVEYMGRTDHQFKIRGYRVDIREIEQGLQSHPLVEKAVALVRSREGVLNLCGYIVLRRDSFLKTEDLRTYLQGVLADYMIPSELYTVSSIPMRPNGKVDATVLLQQQPEVVDSLDGNKTEGLLSEIWKQVLGIPHVGLDENFFTIGGDSIKAIQVIARLHRAGFKSELNNIFLFPSIRQLARTVTQKETIADQSMVTGKVVLTPIQKTFFELASEPYCYNQSLLLKAENRLDEEGVRQALLCIQEHHDALRMIFFRKAGEWIQQNAGKDHPLDLGIQDIRGGDPANKMIRIIEEVHRSMNIETGPLLKCCLIRTDAGDRLLIVIHHLIVDGVSWRILFEDLDTAYQQFTLQKPIQFPSKSDSFQKWAQKLLEYAASPQLTNEQPYWEALLRQDFTPLPCDRYPSVPMSFQNGITTVTLSEEDTNHLKSNVHEAYSTSIDDLLLTALILSIHNTLGLDVILIEMESHGREGIISNVDVTRTVGWFTARYPVMLKIAHADNLSLQIKETKEMLRRVANKGIGYGVLRYMKPNNTLPVQEPQIGFNYLGQFDQELEGKTFSVAPESSGSGGSRNNSYLLNYVSVITEGKLSLSLSFDKNYFKEETANMLAVDYLSSLSEIISHCKLVKNKEITPSDLTYKGLSLDELDTIFN